MALSDAVKKAVKTISKAIPENEITDDLVAGYRKIVDSKVVKGTFKQGKSSWLLNHHEKAFKSIEFMPGTHYSIKKRFTVPIALGVGAYGMVRDTRESIKDARLSDMQADELSGTVSQSRSPNIDAYEKARNPNIQNKDQLAEARGRTPYALRTGGAAGDLVFALHELKGGGR